MAFTLTVAGFDFAPHLRVSPGEGFDPFDVDLIEFGMSESTGIEGPSLLSETAGAREMVIPVHLTPLKDSNYLDTKQGLHDMLRDVNATLSAAKGMTAVWQDEGADSPTTYDIIAARYEAEYNFRRAQAKWGSGIVRVFVKPFGHTGSYRILGTAAATFRMAAVVETLEGAVLGDAPAHIEAIITTGSYAVGNARAVGIAILPNDNYNHSFPAASINGFTLASVADPLGVGSYSREAGSLVLSAALAAGDVKDTRLPPTGRLDLSPASAYSGRNRVFAVVEGQGAQIAAYSEGMPIGPGGMASVLGGHNMIDLGVLEVGPLPGQATVSMDIYAYAVPGDDTFYSASDQLSAPVARINQFLVLPEDSMALIVDTRRRLISDTAFSNPDAGFGSIVTGTTDRQGNYWTAEQGQMSWKTLDTNQISLASSAVFANNSICLGSVQDMDLQTEVTFTQVLGTPSLTIMAHRGGLLGVTAKLHQANGSQSLLAIRGGSTLLNSVTFSTPTYGTLYLRNLRTDLSAMVRNGLGTILGTVAASSLNTLSIPGKPGLGVGAGSGLASIGVTGFRCEVWDGLERGPRDRILIRSEDNLAVSMSNASVFKRSMVPFIRGVIPQAQPSINNRIVAFHLPMTHPQRAADLLSFEVRVLERWRYAR